jgi:hypothetical protein
MNIDHRIDENYIFCYADIFNRILKFRLVG